jgi:hypothetical protein
MLESRHQDTIIERDITISSRHCPYISATLVYNSQRPDLPGPAIHNLHSSSQNKWESKNIEINSKWNVSPMQQVETRQRKLRKI